MSSSLFVFLLSSRNTPLEFEILDEKENKMQQLNAHKNEKRGWAPFGGKTICVE